MVFLLFVPLFSQADTYRLTLLPTASDALREGMVRIVNHSDESGQVALTAIDDSGLAFGPVTLEIGARQAIRFSSLDLEHGNEAVGIATGIGGGQGDWRLVLDTPLDIEPSAARTYADGTICKSVSISRRTSPDRVPSPSDRPFMALPDTRSAASNSTARRPRVWRGDGGNDS